MLANSQTNNPKSQYDQRKVNILPKIKFPRRKVTFPATATAAATTATTRPVQSCVQGIEQQIHILI